MKLKLRHKVTGLALFSALLPAVVLAILVYWQERKSTEVIANQLDEMISENLSQILRDVYNMCVNANDLVQLQVNGALGVANHQVEDEGGINIGEKQVRWRAVNQLTGEEESIELPEMLVGDTWLGQNSDIAKYTPVVDMVQETVGGTATIFQRMNAAGDMLRIATNVKTSDGRRAIGTYIPAIDPDGQPNPVVSTVMKGEIFRGNAYVVDNWYVSAYEPIYDDKQEIVGMLYVGVKRESVDSLRRAMNAVTVGEKGYVWIMFGEDKQRRDIYTFTGDGVPDRYDVSKITDITGNAYLENFRAEAIKLKPGEQIAETITWEDATGREHIKEIHYTYFRPWDWVIGVTAFEEEFSQPHREIENAFAIILQRTVIGAIVTLIIIGVVATILGGYIARPISYLTNIAGLVAAGRLGDANRLMEQGCNRNEGDSRMNLARQQDETGQLFRAILEMIRNLNALIGRVKDSSSQLAGAASEITGTAKLQEGTVQDFGSSSSEIAAAVKEISSTSQELSNTMNKVSDTARSTAGVAGDGRNHLDHMRVGIEGLEEATQSITGKLSVIAERAQNINAVVTTIAKVADQTNLLSLNAAIEAEKAGEYGLGFAVVAREIRRLADQTAVATQDIEQMVKEMQSSVSAGVMEMDKFNEAVRNGIDNVARLSGQMETIIQQVEAITPRFDSVREGMSSQAVGASQISEAVSNLNAAAHQTSASLDGFRSATEKLGQAVEAMQEGIAQFRTETTRDEVKEEEGEA